MAYSVEEEEQRRAQQGIGGAQPVTGGGGAGGGASLSPAGSQGSGTSQNRLGAYLNAPNLAAGAGMGNTLAGNLNAQGQKVGQQVSDAHGSLLGQVRAEDQRNFNNRLVAPNSVSEAQSQAAGSVYKGPQDASAITQHAGAAADLAASANRLGSFAGRGVELQSAGMGGGSAGGRRLNSWLTGAGGQGQLNAAKDAWGNNKLGDQINTSASDIQGRIGQLQHNFQATAADKMGDASRIAKSQADAEQARLAQEAANAPPRKKGGVAGFLQGVGDKYNQFSNWSSETWAPKGGLVDRAARIGSGVFTGVGYANWALTNGRDPTKVTAEDSKAFAEYVAGGWQ